MFILSNKKFSIFKKTLILVSVNEKVFWKDQDILHLFYTLKIAITISNI